MDLGDWPTDLADELVLLDRQVARGTLRAIVERLGGAPDASTRTQKRFLERFSLARHAASLDLTNREMQQHIEHLGRVQAVGFALCELLEYRARATH
jgi:hypothetical protein